MKNLAEHSQLSTTPVTRAPARFNRYLLLPRQASTLLLILNLGSFSHFAILPLLLDLFIETAFSQSTQRTTARSMIYEARSPAVFNSLLCDHLCGLGRFTFLLGGLWLQAMDAPSVQSHTIVSPFTLDGFHVPRRGVGDTGEISKGLLASTEIHA